MPGPLFSANSHFIEPAHIFEGRVPAKWKDRAPRVVDVREGQGWQYENQLVPFHVSCATAGIPPEQWTGNGVLRYEDMRPGVYDSKARLRDMDEDGVAAAVIYSSPASMGFTADLFYFTQEPDLSHACMRAYNDWVHEEWAAADRTRLVAVGATSFFDPQVAADEVRRNAARGFRGVLFREPADFGLPWTGFGHWDPFFKACEETGTVIIHHTISIAHWPHAPEPWGPSKGPRPPYGMTSTIWQSGAMETVLSWIWAGLFVRFPKLKINIAESGGGWLPYLIKRMDWAFDWSPLHRKGWPDESLRPIDFMRKFSFSTQEIDVVFDVDKRLGMNNLMFEDDYPHMESVWPKTQQWFDEGTAGMAPDKIEGLRWRNASELFNFPMPAITSQLTPAE